MRTTTNKTIHLSYERGHRVLFLGMTIFSLIASDALSDFQSDRGDLTRATFEIAFSTKLWSGSRRNVEKGYQDIKQLLAKSHPE